MKALQSNHSRILEIKLQLRDRVILSATQTLNPTRVDDKWHVISRMLECSTDSKWSIPLLWHGIESSISVEYSNILLLNRKVELYGRLSC